ncbi:hypothetical protein BGZ76_005159, partial [Entomortierella beljakovae]
SKSWSSSLPHLEVLIKDLDTATFQPWLDRHEDRWYLNAHLGSSNELLRLFWMSPLQIENDRKYNDILVCDTTGGKSRMKADDTNEVDFMEGGIMPKSGQVDEDAAMELACRTVLPNTRVFNCSWHMDKNLEKLHSTLGSNWGKFKERFDLVRSSGTWNEFEYGWESLNREGKFGKMVMRSWKIYKKRVNWAGPSINVIFTAGMRSTQRVEKTHHVIKALNVNSKTQLSKIFDIIDAEVVAEYRNDVIRHTNELEKENAGLKLTGTSEKAFKEIIDVNNRYLTQFARNKIREQMEDSFIYDSVVVDVKAKLESISGNHNLKFFKSSRSALLIQDM